MTNTPIPPPEIRFEHLMSAIEDAMTFIPKAFTTDLAELTIREFIWVTPQMKMDRECDFWTFSESDLDQHAGFVSSFIDGGAKWIRISPQGSGLTVEGWK